MDGGDLVGYQRGMSIVLSESDRAALQAYSRGELSAIDLRRRLNDATFGDVLALLRAEGLKLPRAPTAGREEELARARAWLFPKHDR